MLANGIQVINLANTEHHQQQQVSLAHGKLSSIIPCLCHSLPLLSLQFPVFNIDIVVSDLSRSFAVELAVVVAAAAAATSVIHFRIDGQRDRVETKWVRRTL